MSDLTEVSAFDANVNGIDDQELSSSGLFNDAAQSLANRTRFLYDALRMGMKIPVTCATTGANITRSGIGQSIDGVTVADGNSVLVKDQTSMVQNGIFIVSSGGWLRRFDSDTSSAMNAALVTVTKGTLNANTIWQQQTLNPIIDEQNLEWKQIYPHSFDDLTDLPTTVAGYKISDMHLYSPPGAVTAYAGASVPLGWFECNGQSLSKTTYAALYSALGNGTIYGQTDTTFDVPDLRGEFIRGWAHGMSTDPTAGRAVGSAQGDAIQNIVGHFGIDDRAQNYAATGPFSYSGGISSTGSTGAADGISVIFDASAQVRTSTETRPRNIAMMYIIKY